MSPSASTARCSWLRSSMKPWRRARSSRDRRRHLRLHHSELPQSGEGLTDRSGGRSSARGCRSPPTPWQRPWPARPAAEVIVPPSPGTVGALGIALLAAPGAGGGRQRKRPGPLDSPALSGSQQVIRKDTFICKSTKGCGGSGNKCRIDRLTTRVEGQRQKFVWGGNCSLYDRGTGKQKLPDRAPDPFRERRGAGPTR